jgi:hypothetical protein
MHPVEADTREKWPISAAPKPANPSSYEGLKISALYRRDNKIWHKWFPGVLKRHGAKE